jgi:hypothetical protein
VFVEEEIRLQFNPPQVQPGTHDIVDDKLKHLYPLKYSPMRQFKIVV